MTVQIGINPITWSNDDLPELGKHISLEQCLEEGKQAGYSGFELGNKFPRQADKLAAAFAPHQLNLVSGWFSGAVAEISAEEEIARIDDHLQLLKTLGAKVIVYCDVTGAIHCDQTVPLSKRPILNEKQWPGFCEKLSQVAEHCLKQGVQLAYHHHMGTIIQTPAEIAKLMAGTSNALGLLLDTGHLSYAGGDPVAMFSQFADRVNHVHCKDVRAVILEDALNRDISFLDAVLNGAFTVPSDGSVNYDALFSLLHQHAYSGWLVVEAEQDPSVAPSLEYAKLGVNNLKKLCATHQILVKD